MLHKHLTLASILAAAMATATTDTIQMHETPSTDGAVISTLDLSKGITILPNKWVQVQDPVTKKIGWATQEDVQKILKSNNTTTTIASNSNGNYSSVAEIHTTNNTNSAAIAKSITEEEQKMKLAFKENLRSFQKIGEVTNGIFDNIFSESV